MGRGRWGRRDDGRGGGVRRLDGRRHRGSGSTSAAWADGGASGRTRARPGGGAVDRPAGPAPQPDDGRWCLGCRRHRLAAACGGSSSGIRPPRARELGRVVTAQVIVTPTAAASFPAIGTTATVVVTDRAVLREAAEVLREDLAALDRSCSRFRSGSEIRRLERTAGAVVEVGETLAVHIDAALRAAEATGGLVDPTVGRCLDALGYDRDFAEITDSDEPIVPVPAPGWWRLGWDAARRRVLVPRGVRLDLGSTAKALAADLAALRIASRAGCGVLVGLGGDLAAAGPPPAGGWRVRVTDDHAGGPGAIVTIESGGLATSGTARRRWRRGRLECHHLVDPRTGLPVVGPWRTVSVAAGSCVDANTAATAAFVLGSDGPDQLAAARLPARLVGMDGAVHAVAGWPTEEGRR